MQQLIDADEVALPLPVRLELWAGVSRQQRQDFGRRLDALAQLVPTEDTWRPLPGWIERAAESSSLSEVPSLITSGVTGFKYGMTKGFPPR